LAKKRPEKPRYELTRRQRSRRQQQQRRQRIIVGVAILIVVAVLSVIGVGVYQGWYVKDVKPLHEVVLEVNGTKFDMGYYIKMLKFYTQNIDPNYVYLMANSVVDVIERNELVRQAAPGLGITASDEEVNELMNSSTPPLPEEYRDIAVAQVLLNKMRDDYFGPQVPQYADQRHVMAMFLESEAQANDIAARVESGESFGDLAAEFSLDDTTQKANGDLGWCPPGVLSLKENSTVLEDSAFSAEVGTLSPPVYEEGKSRKVGYWLIEVESIDTSAQPTEAKAKVMLLASEQEANDIRDRLEAGEDFATLAKEFSQDSDSNADGGEITISPGDKTTAFDAYVFDPNVELGVLSPVIRDEDSTVKGGYWLIEVVASQPNSKIDDDNLLILKNGLLTDWLEKLKDDPANVIVDNLNATKMQWAILQVTGGTQ
jgi:parvulin-like peptidyl-prolyl isomerase